MSGFSRERYAKKNMASLCDDAYEVAYRPYIRTDTSALMTLSVCQSGIYPAHHSLVSVLSPPVDPFDASPGLYVFDILLLGGDWSKISHFLKENVTML